MNIKSILYILAGLLFLAESNMVLSADQNRTRQMDQVQQQEQIYGSQLMTPEERAEYRAKMRAAKTAEERERIRQEHHELMQERAKTQGMTIPDEPGTGRGGMMGPGGGKGSGGGMGPHDGGMGQGKGR